jgi:glucuronide carrier protein
VTGQAAVTDQEAREAPEKLRAPQYLGYAVGDIANNLTFMMTSMFLLIYYTDVVGIPAAAVGTLFLLVRIWDGLADIFAGRVVDKTSTRWGKFRPFLLFGSLPLLLLNVAVFTVPDLGEAGTLVYAYVSYAVFGLAYSMVNIPYGSLAGAMTQDSEERSRLASFRVIGSNLAILTLAIVVAPQIEGSENLQLSLTITVLIFVVVGVALYLFTFFTAREQVERDVATVTLRETVATVRQNGALVVLCLSSLAFLVGMFSLQTVGIYYARDVLGNASLYIFLTVAQTAGTFAGALALPRVAGALGKKRTYISAGAVAIVAGVGLALAPASVPAIAVVLFGVYGLGLGGANTVSWALQADTVEYGEWKTGFRTEGATYSLFSFTRKVGQALGAAAASYAIGLGGYVAAAETQPGSAIAAIRIAAGAVPAVVILVAIFIMTAYPLTEDKFRQIVREIAERRAARRSDGTQDEPA